MPLLWVAFFLDMLVTRVGRRGREKRAGRRGREKGAESEAVIDTIQHRGGRQCDKLQVLPWLPTPMCHSRLVPCPWPKTLPFRQAKERAQKARGGDRRREEHAAEALHEKFDQLVVYEHVNTEDEKMKECVQQRRGPCVTGKATRSRVLTAEEDLCVNVQESLALRDTAAATPDTTSPSTPPTSMHP